MARYHENRREAAYRIYVTDALLLTCESAAKQAGGSYLTARFKDIIDGEPKETRTGAEIAADVISRGGITVIVGKNDTGKEVEK